MENNKIRENIKKEGIYLWQVADYLGITDSALSKKLRYKLSDEDRIAIENAIKELRKNDAAK